MNIENKDFGGYVHRILWTKRFAITFQRKPDRHTQPNEIVIGLHILESHRHYGIEFKWQEVESSKVRELNMNTSVVTNLDALKREFAHEH